MRQLLIILIVAAFVSSCNNGKENNSSATGTNNPDTVNVFPYKDMIINDLKDVETVPYFMYKKSTDRFGKKDSSVFAKEGFKSFADQFLKEDITLPSFKTMYKETVFHDLSTKSISITYTTSNQSLPIREVTILVDDETNKPKNIFIYSIINNSDSSVDEHYAWNIGRSFSISRSVRRKDGTESDEKNYVCWNDKN